MVLITVVKMVKVPTPCVGICTTGLGDNVCRGCKRFSKEVIGWNSLNPDKQWDIEDRLTTTLDKAFDKYLTITNGEVLKSTLSEYVYIPKHRSLKCQAFILIINNKKKFEDLLTIGITPHKEYVAVATSNIISMIDSDWYKLNLEEYDRRG